jgi:hypothetical protein
MRHLTLGGKRWRVTFPRRINGDGRVGECDYAAKVIRLKGDESSPEMRWTLVHEVCHATVDDWLKTLPRRVREEVEGVDGEESLVGMLEAYLRSAHDQVFELWP